MKAALKWIGIAFGALVAVVLGLFVYVEATWSLDYPDTPLPAIQASTDPAVIAQGEYIVHAVAHCSACHGPAELVEARKIDFTKPMVGGNVWHAGPFGKFVAANLTPHETGIGLLSDAELARAIRHSVRKDGTLAPFMRIVVGPMSDEDLTAVVSYLRAQPPVAAEHEAEEVGFIAKALSSKFTPRTDPAPPYFPLGATSVERGRYLAEGPAMCVGCHTPLDPMSGFAPSGPLFSGAGPEPDHAEEGYEIVAPNLTPDLETGHIAKWTEDDFVARFRSGTALAGTKMPWPAFQKMAESDLRSIYRYLKTVPAAKNDMGPIRREIGSFKP